MVADNKERLHIRHRKNAGYSVFFVVGVSKGASLWHTTLLAKCNVLYALSALLRKWAFHRERQGDLQQPESGAVFVAGEAANAGPIASADRACVKSPVLRHPAHIGAICPEVPCLWSWVPEVEQQLMNSKWKCGKPLSGFPRLDYPSAKPGAAVNGGCIYAPVYLER